MKEALTSFWEGATFLPHDEPSRSELLREKVWKANEAAFIVFGLKLSLSQPELCLGSGFTRFFESFKSLAREERQRIVEYPPFLIWLKQNMDPSCAKPVIRDGLAELQRLIAGLEKARHDPYQLKLKGASICVERYQVDPLIATAAFPEYKFPDLQRQREFEEQVAYPLSFFREMLTLALERIARAWPEAHQDFLKFVRIIVDMIDGDFTSYSACDHMGVIFVSTDNSPLVALEEYLMHEFGHQVLYNVMQLDPLVLMENKQTFKLPWSGNERDIYGYFHAFFIYILLAHYLQRVTGRSQREQRRINARASHIIKGLVHAIPEIEGADSFTPRGRQLFENLKTEVDQLNTKWKFREERLAGVGSEGLPTAVER